MARICVGIAVACAISSAPAQEVPPGGAGPWSFEEIIINVVEAAQSRRTNDIGIPIANTGEPNVLTRTFATLDDCRAARAALLAFGFDIVLGTGGGGIAHIGRFTSDCFHGL